MMKMFYVQYLMLKMNLVIRSIGSGNNAKAVRIAKIFSDFLICDKVCSLSCLSCLCDNEIFSGISLIEVD